MTKRTRWVAEYLADYAANPVTTDLNEWRYDSELVAAARAFATLRIAHRKIIAAIRLPQLADKINDIAGTWTGEPERPPRPEWWEYADARLQPDDPNLWQPTARPQGMPNPTQQDTERNR